MNVGKEETAELLDFCFNVINKTLFEMSQKRAESDRRVLANMLLADVIKRYYNLTKDEIINAFSKGVREGEEMSINPRTWNKWLRTAKMQSNAYRIKLAQENKVLLLETNKSPEELSSITEEFIELCIVEPFEEYCEEGAFRISGISIVYKYLEEKKLIILDNIEKRKMLEKAEKTIKARRKYHNKEFEPYDAKTMCRETVLKRYFKKWRTEKLDMRKILMG